MNIHRVSPVTGKLNTLDLPITPIQWDRYKSGTLIQRAFPQLTPDQREFIISGCTPEDWEIIADESEQGNEDIDPEWETPKQPKS